MKTVLAFDPAAEVNISDTGFALLEYSKDTTPSVLQSGVIHGGFEGFVEWVRRDKLEADTIVSEQFIQNRKAADVSPLLIEGVIRFVYPNVVLQPSSSLSMVSEEHLKSFGFWSKVGHHKDANSALRHALFWLRSERHKPTLRGLSNLS